MNLNELSEKLSNAYCALEALVEQQGNLDAEIWQARISILP